MRLNRFIVHIEYRESGTDKVTAATATEVKTNLNLEQLEAQYVQMSTTIRTPHHVYIIPLEVYNAQ